MGYPDVTVEPYISWSRDEQTIAAVFEVRPGDRAVLATFELEGLPPGLDPTEFTPEIKIGKKLSADMMETLRERVERRLRRAGYWEAKALDVRRSGPAAESTVQVEVDLGPSYRLDLRTPPETGERVREALPDVATEDLNPAQTDALAERIEERLREDGFPIPEVSVALETVGDTENLLIVHVDPGPRIKVETVEFPGANLIDPKRLADIVSIDKGSGSSRNPLTAARLENDRKNLEDFYLRQGFQDIRVSSPSVERIDEKSLLVRFPIDEGLRWTIDSFKVSGAPSEVLGVTDNDSFQMETTDPWDPRELDTVVERWNRALGDVGYPEARVTADVETPETGRVRIELSVQPGSFVRLGPVMIAGLTQTKKSLVRRALGVAGLQEGVPYSRATIERAQQELYRLGLFRRVSIVPIPGQERRIDRGVVVQLEEGLQRSYLLGVGWGTVDRFRLTLGWSHLNLFGGGHALSLETRYSSREFRFQIGLREPILPWIHQPGYAAIYRTEEIYTDWQQLRYGVWFEAGDRLKAPFRHWVRYEYQVVQPDAPDEILSELERENQQIELSSITVPFEWDRRNDMLNPTSGFLVTVAPEYAFPLFSATSEFFKLRTGISHYFDAAGGRIGWGLRVGATWGVGFDPDEPANLQLPLAVRFFAGGPASHRAFRTDRLGTPGETLDEDGKAIGGNAVALFNFEYSVPIWSALRAVVFVDGGNVWVEPSDISLDEFRWGVGAGLRFDTPAGPFRLEYGHKLDRYPGESSGELYFSFGMAF